MLINLLISMGTSTAAAMAQRRRTGKFQHIRFTEMKKKKRKGLINRKNHSNELIGKDRNVQSISKARVMTLVTPNN